MKPLPNLLIVDDAEENLLFLEKLLRKLPVNIIRALSGQEALEKTKDLELALAIIDVRMPVMNGYELAIKMKEERSGIKVPIIFITASHVNEMQIFEGYGSGAVDYIFKPINNHILLCKINVFLDLFNQRKTIISDTRVVKMMKEAGDELARVNAALVESEEKYRVLIENSHDIIYTLDAGGVFTFVSPVWTILLGHPVHEVVGQMFQKFVHPEDTSLCQAWLDNVIETGQRHDGIDYRVQHLDGRWFWHTSAAVPFKDHSGRTAGFYGIARDITERRQAEKERIALEQLHQLAEYTEKARENERVAIARELHDDLGQALTAVKIDLGIIKQTVVNEEAVLKINKVSTLVSETIKTIQRLTAQLRPAIIDDLGLEAAIEWYTSEFEERYGIEVLLEMDSGINISSAASLIIFRIMQESLTNIARHSQASRVVIELSKYEGSIQFKVSDNGIGITETEIRSRKSFGIIGMSERAASLGGTFEISSDQGRGTHIKLTLPLNIQGNYENSDM
jgi:two-component system sensor histidine kinase UhpB